MPDLLGLTTASIDGINPVNREHPVNQGLSDWWLGLPLNSGGAYAYDALGGPAATFHPGVGTAGWSSELAPDGSRALAVTCAVDPAGDGNAAYVTYCPAAAYPDGLTLAAWVKAGPMARDGVLGNFPVVLGSFQDDATGFSINQRPNAAAGFPPADSFYCSGLVAGGGTPLVSTGAGAADGNWHFLAASIGAAGTYLLYDTSIFSDATPVGSFTAASPITSGCRSHSGTASQHPDLKIAAIRVYAKQLLPAVLVAVYRESAARYPGALNRPGPADALFFGSGSSPPPAATFRRTAFRRSGSRGVF